MGGAATLWATNQRHRRRTTLVLAWLVLALTGALALGAATGARRAASAFDRLREQTSASEVNIEEIDLDAIGEGITNEEAVLRLLPLIAAAGATYQEQFNIFPVGYEMFPTYDFYPIVQRQLLNHPTDVPVVLAGRMPLATEPDEVALSQQMADVFGVGVGDSVSFESASNDWLYRSFSSADPGPKDGPPLELAVTGIVVSPLDFTSPSGTIYLTTAFGEAYGSRVGSSTSVEILLDDHVRAAEMSRTGSPNSGDHVLDAAISIAPSRWGDQQQVSDGLGVVATALWIFAGAVAVAGLATVALIVKRLSRSVSVDVDVLSALGVGRSGRSAFGVLLLAPVIALGGVATFIGAPGVARFARLGLAEHVEPDRGISLDWPVLTIGTTCFALAMVAVTAFCFLTIGRGADTSSNRNSHPAVKRPIALTLGVREALGVRGPGHGAIITAACLMATVMTSVVVGASLDRLPTRPNLWGGGSDLVIDFGEREGGRPNVAYDRALQALAADRRMEALTGTATFYPEIDGRSLTAFAVDTRRGEPILTIVSGHGPHNPGEIVMGRATMSRHDLHLGDDVDVTVAGQTESFQLVGQAVFPVGDVGAFDDSLAVTTAGGNRFAAFDGENGTNQILLTWASGLDEAQARRDLEHSGYRVLDRPRLPPPVTNLIQVEQVPGLLALFFGALGVASLGYMLGASSRSRGRQFAVLATLGLQPRQVASIIRWQAITIALAAALIGVPAGLVVARVVWTAIAEGAGVAVSHATPVGALMGVPSLAVFAAGAIAIALSNGVRRRRLALLLRAG